MVFPYIFYSNQTFTFNILDKCLDLLSKFHNFDYPITIDPALIKQNYIDKLRERFNHNDYFFDDADIVFQSIIDGLEQNYAAKIVSIIHGDYWFSNIILMYSDDICCIDMKGQVFGELTLNGDMYYDYGKLYQSILGYDLILNRKPINTEYFIKMREYFLCKYTDLGLNLVYLRWVTKSLIFGTFHCLKPDAPKSELWNLIKSI